MRRPPREGQWSSSRAGHLADIRKEDQAKMVAPGSPGTNCRPTLVFNLALILPPPYFSKARTRHEHPSLICPGHRSIRGRSLCTTVAMALGPNGPPRLCYARRMPLDPSCGGCDTQPSGTRRDSGGCIYLGGPTKRSFWYGSLALRQRSDSGISVRRPLLPTRRVRSQQDRGVQAGSAGPESDQDRKAAGYPVSSFSHPQSRNSCLMRSTGWRTRIPN